MKNAEIKVWSLYVALDDLIEELSDPLSELRLHDLRTIMDKVKAIQKLIMDIL